MTAISTLELGTAARMITAVSRHATLWGSKSRGCSSAGTSVLVDRSAEMRVISGKPSAAMAREAVAAMQEAAARAPRVGLRPEGLPVDHTLPSWTTRVTGNPLYPLGWVYTTLVERDEQLVECSAGGPVCHRGSGDGCLCPARL